MPTIKTHGPLLLFHAVLVLGVVALIWHKDVTWPIGIGFLVSAGIIPGYVGARPSADEGKG